MPRWLTIAIAQCLVLIVAGGLIHVPFHYVAPGETRNVLTEIHVIGAKTYPSKGELLITTASVSSAPLTAWEALAVWFSPTYSTIPRPFVVPPGSSDDEVDLQNQRDIEQSKVNAAVAAFRALGHEVPRVRGALVLKTLPDTPAAKSLRAWDRIVAIDGAAVDGQKAAARRIAARDPGEAIELTVIRAKRERTVKATTKEADGRAVLGVLLGTPFDFPSDVVIDSGEIVGPSAGLVFALSIADAFTRSDLTQGRVIAVTGTISLDRKTGEGIVGPVGGVSEKVRGAHRDGATVFVAPPAEAAEAERVAPPEMSVIAVSTLKEAIRALRTLEPR